MHAHAHAHIHTHTHFLPSFLLVPLPPPTAQICLHPHWGAAGSLGGVEHPLILWLALTDQDSPTSLTQLSLTG